MNMNKLGIFLIASAVLLSACGQRSDDLVVNGIGQVDANGNPIDPDSPSLGAALPDILDVRVISDVSNLDTGSIAVATITAYVLDEDNNSVSGEPVRFRSTGVHCSPLIRRPMIAVRRGQHLVCSRNFASKTS